MSEKPLDGYSVQIATPCLDASYDRHYVKAFSNTCALLIALGARVDWAEFPYCSDVALARLKIFGNFYRSTHTHMMMIDADMGWSPHDVVRLLLSGKDFIGAAGPKKVYPVCYAVKNFTDDGTAIPFEGDDNGVMTATDIGGAFVLMSRGCAEKMVNAHPDLAFPGDNGVTEYALYEPMLVGEGVNRRRLSEDFAFCRRWRALGEEVYFLPDVTLSHAGSHTWTGSLHDSAVSKMEETP